MPASSREPSKLTSYHVAGLGFVAALGVLLVMHSLWSFVEEPILAATRSGSQGLSMLGWVYLTISVLGAALLYHKGGAVTPSEMLAVTLLAFPLLVLVFQAEFLQLTPAPLGLEGAAEFSLFMFPVALAFPMGIAARTCHWQEFVIGALIWLAAWFFLYGYLSGGGNPWSPFVLLLLVAYYLQLTVFTLPTFVVGFLLGPHVVKKGDSSHDTSKYEH